MEKDINGIKEEILADALYTAISATKKAKAQEYIIMLQWALIIVLGLIIGGLLWCY